jgi:hypothetical protein
MKLGMNILPLHLHAFQFSVISITNTAAMQASEVEVTLVTM